ncbi:MAG: M48 family metallopeptidase [Saprospiraceae bacterium]|nr:M48 family metallopeptidase [Saprospiraceae bacterium]MDW8484024.1 M48 family metallopeptidase [Saprospiraceae bacterium]
MTRQLFICLLISGVLTACTKTAFTGRKQMALIPASELNQMSFSEYRAFLKKNPTLASGPEVELVRRVGNDIKEAVEVYYRAQGKANELRNFAWEFNVVDNPAANAFCMPGGKVVVFTGILKITQNEDALAVVMGHEVAHALANHGNERMSQLLLAQLGLTSLQVALASKPAQTRDILLAAAGFGTQVGVLLPFSRKHETEADEIGLYLMAMAGYDPNEAAPFWERMNRSSGGAPPEFLSTHPDPSKRSERLKQLVPKARAYAMRYPVPNSSKNRR